MKLRIFWIILIIIGLILLFSRHIINLIFNISRIKKMIADKINQSIKMIDLDSNINPGYMTTLYDLKLFVNDFKADDFSIYLDSLKRIVLIIKKCSGSFSFKFYTGPSYYVSYGDKVSVEIDSLYLNYTIDIINYNPFKIAYNNFYYNIAYNVESDKKISQLIINKGLSYYKDSIEQQLTKFLKDVPNMVPILLKDEIKQYELILKIIEKYSEIHSKYMPL